MNNDEQTSTTAEKFVQITKAGNLVVLDPLTLTETFFTANEAHDLPYNPGLSVGTIEVPSDDPRSLDECVQAADALMYENKKRRKGLK